MVTCAWPYAYGIPHLGNLIGSALSGDVIARYLRLKGEEVLYVSGSDEHGTPIEVEAVKRGIPPKKLTDRVHAEIKRLFTLWGISFDNYTRTESEVHKQFVRDFYTDVYRNGYVFTRTTEQLYCPKCKRFLPDRFVIGTCPYCGYPYARGDQCENCGRLLEPTQLINPRCAICGSKPVVKTSKHWYIDLPKLEGEVRKYVEGNRNFDEATRSHSLSYIKDGLKPRALTRDNKWGIPAPFPGSEGKTIYVWMEAVLGYISAVIEYFKNRGEEERWKEYWLDKETRTLFFIGKDNIPFHTIIFPALLMASGRGFVLPWNVSATEFLNFNGQKFSKTRGIGIWIDEALELAPADYWRYALLYVRPEGRDTDFSLKLFESLVNGHLNDTIGNFIHRTLLFVWRYFKGRVPNPGELDTTDIDTLRSVEELFSKVGELLDRIEIKRAVATLTEMARVGNRYLNVREPWKEVKVDERRAATTIYVASQIVALISVAMAPFLPFSAERLREMLNLKGQMKWEKVGLEPGHKINRPSPLFHKVSASAMEERLREIRGTAKLLDASGFLEYDIRVARIREARYCPSSSRYIVMKVDGGDKVIQVVGRLGEHYRPEELVGKTVVAIFNLKPKKVCGMVSEGMLLATAADGKPVFLTPEREVPVGSKIY